MRKELIVIMGCSLLMFNCEKDRSINGLWYAVIENDYYETIYCDHLTISCSEQGLLNSSHFKQDGNLILYYKVSNSDTIFQFKDSIISFNSQKLELQRGNARMAYYRSEKVNCLTKPNLLPDGQLRGYWDRRKDLINGKQ